MNTKERIELKRKLREIAKSDIPLNRSDYDYFKQTFIEIKPTQKEIINLIHNLLKVYHVEETDYELIIAEFLFKQIKEENFINFKLSTLYFMAVYNSCDAILRLLLNYNVPITPEVYEDLFMYFDKLEEQRFRDRFVNINKLREMQSIIITISRKHKIERFKSNKQTTI